MARGSPAPPAATPGDPGHPGNAGRAAHPPDDPGQRLLLSMLVVVLVAMSAVLWAVFGSGPLKVPVGPPAADPPATTTPQFLHIQHAVVIVLENREVGQVWAGAPYQTYLQAHYGNATQFYALCHGSPPNYLAMTSGRPSYCGANVSGSVNAVNLADLLQRAGLSWAGYFESMPSPCDPHSQGQYVEWHDPFVAYDDIIDDPARCAAHVLPSGAFNASVANGTLPTVSFYVPNAIDDCDDSALASCDLWLRGFLAPILNASDPATESLVAHTAFFIVYDEGATNAGFASPVITPECVNTTGKALTTCGGHVYLTAVSPYSVGTSYAGVCTSYNLESTIEWLFGLPGDGGYDGTADFPPMTGLFNFTANTD